VTTNTIILYKKIKFGADGTQWMKRC